MIFLDVIYPPPPYDFPFPNAEVLKKLPVIKDKHINQSLTFGQNSVNMLWRLEENLVNSGIAVQQDSPTYGQVITHSPTDEAQHIYKHSALITKASNNLINLYCER